MNGFYIFQIVHTALSAEFREPAGSIVVSPPRMFILDIGGEEIEEALGRPSLPQEQGGGLGTGLSQAVRSREGDE
jgi:hypothetical protein